MGEGDYSYSPLMIYDTLEDTLLTKPDPKVLDLEDAVMISKEDYTNLLVCRDAARKLKEGSEKFFEVWYNSGKNWWGSSMPKFQAYTIAFNNAVVEANNFRTSIFYRIWRKLNPRNKWKIQK